MAAPKIDALLHDTTLSYLQSHHVMTLATQGPAGLWAAAVFYVNDGLTLYFLSSPTSRHSQNLETSGRVAATIQEDTHDWRAIEGIQLEGGWTYWRRGTGACAVALWDKSFPLSAIWPPRWLRLLKAMSRIAWHKITPERLFFVSTTLGDLDTETKCHCMTNPDQTKPSPSAWSQSESRSTGPG